MTAIAIKSASSIVKFAIFADRFLRILGGITVGSIYTILNSTITIGKGYTSIRGILLGKKPDSAPIY